MKLRKLHIEDYKLFKDFDISFVDENDEALPIIVLAGVNGSGKTSLLEFIVNYFKNEKNEFIRREQGIPPSLEFLDDSIDTDDSHPIDTHKMFLKQTKFDNTIYLSAGSDEIKNIKETIRQKYIDRAFEIDKPSQALNELQNFIINVFNGLDLTFNLSNIKYNQKKVLFKDNNEVEFDIEKLSTGEKTLLSKVLYLYFQDYKDKVILIDEPELSLHPSWQNKVLKIYENFAIKNNCQIIIATHSPHIIGSTKPEYIRLLKKENNKIIVIDNIDRSYGLEFNKILTDIMGAETRVSDVSERLSKIKKLIVNNDFESEEFKSIWNELENLIGTDNIDLRLLKLEIASRKKNVQNK